MIRIQPLESAQADGKAQALYQGIQQQLGSVPNIFKTLGHAPAALEGHLNNMATLSGGVLSGKLREQIAMVSAGTNSCDYCASAHTVLGKMAGVDEAELAANLKGQSNDGKTQAALSFANAILSNRGQVNDSDFSAVRDAGFSDAEIVEIVAHVSLNIFTNYFNHVAGTEVDFPFVSATA